MNRTSQILTISVLSVLAIILIVCILKHNKENYMNRNFFDKRYQKYGLRPKKPIKLSQLDYINLMTSRNPRTNRLPGAGTLSWESNKVLRNPKQMEVMNLLYGRFCMPPRLSQMGSYAIYKEQNEMMPVEERQ
jgi:hypothetical protein